MLIESQELVTETDASHYADSSAREKLVEHVFLGELLRGLWRKNVRDLEILRPEVDSGGYDLALDCRGIVRHVQLKSSHRDAKRAAITANVKLIDRPSACILWIYFDPDTLLLGPFLWFGGAPGAKISPLGEKVATHTKHNAEREKSLRIGHRVVAKKALRPAGHDRCRYPKTDRIVRRQNAMAREENAKKAIAD
jgi:hypothetical protein